MCIGSCIAPILSDIFFAYHDRLLASCLDNTVLVKVFCFVDDFLLLFACEGQGFEPAVSEVLCQFNECLSPLALTHELPVDDSLRFLDLRLSISRDHLCWMYEPRATFVLSVGPFQAG